MRFFYSLSYILIIGLGIFFKDDYIALLSAVFGLTCTIFSGHGKYKAHIFGFLASLLYSYLAFQEGIIASFILYLFYYTPMYVLGFFNWKKNTIEKEVEKTSLGFLKYAIFACIISLFCAFLTINTDTHPYFDGFIVVYSCFGMYLTVKRAIEQWIFWSIANILSLIMWSILVINGASAVSVIIHWFIYLVLGIVFYLRWKNRMAKS